MIVDQQVVRNDDADRAWLAFLREQERLADHVRDLADVLDPSAPFDLVAVRFPDPRGPSYKLRGSLRDAFARGSRVTVSIAEGRRGGTFRKLGRSSRIDAQGRFTLRFKLRKRGIYRLRYRFKGTSLVLGGKVTKAVRLRR